VYGDAVLVLTRESDQERPEFDVRETLHRGVRVLRINNTFRNVRSFEESYTQPRLATIAADVIDAFAPDVAHIHHLTCLSTRVPELLRSRGVPCFMTLHDYWLLCHRGQLLDRDCRSCPTPGACGNCVDERAAVPATLGMAAALVRRVEPHLPSAGRTAVRAFGTMLATGASGDEDVRRVAAARLAHMREVSSHVARFYAPSVHLRDTFIAAGYPAERIERSPYGLDVNRFTPRSAREHARPLRIGFIGSLMVSKAPHVLLEAFRRLPHGSATLDLFGAYVPYHGNDSYRAVLEPLLRTPGVTLHGWLAETDMHRAYASIDLLVVPSIWPENSPLVIHEAFLAGVPVVASDLGGIPELVHHDENGLLFPAGDADALHAALMRLVSEPACLATLGAHGTAVRTIEDDARAMRANYEAAREHADLKVGSYVHRDTGSDVHQDAGSDVQADLKVGSYVQQDAGSDTHHGGSARVHALVLNYRTPEQTLLAVRSLLASTHALTSVMVVDNSETVECGRLLAELSDRVEYVSTEANLGYSGGMNVGIARALSAGATHVLLVNSDVTVPPDCCTRLLVALADVPESGIAGPVLLARGSPNRIDSAGLSFDITSGRMRMQLAAEPANSALGMASDADAVSGGLMLVERRVFERIGLFDEDYFFGFEDLDFCLRARAAGIRSVVSPAWAYHERAQSLPAHSPERLYFAARNHLRLAALPHGGGAGPARRIAVTMMNVAFALKAPPQRIPARLRAVVSGCLDFHRQRFGARR
ncbi:MAG: glycosyltransferase, partial [Vicinamibacterales bacterium]